MGKKKEMHQEQQQKHSEAHSHKTTSGKQQQQTGLQITHVLMGIGLLALTVYSGWIIVQAPVDNSMSWQQNRIVLQQEMGFLGGLIYLLMQGLMGRGIVLFPVLFCLAGICLLSGKKPGRMQLWGGGMAALVLLAVLHMQVTYIDWKDTMLLGLGGHGGGILGALLSFLLQKALGQAGAYIALFCLGMIALVLIAQGAVLHRGEDFLQAVKQTAVQIKETLLNFIFEPEEEGPEQTQEANQAQEKRTEPKAAEARTRESQRVRPKQQAPKQKTEQMAVQKQPRQVTEHRGLMRGFFGEKASSEKQPAFRKVVEGSDRQPSRPGQRAQSYQPPEYRVIPKEKSVILGSMVEIHKAMDQQEPRTGLSPRGPIENNPYGIQESVEDFQQVMQRRMEQEQPETARPAARQYRQKPAEQAEQSRPAAETAETVEAAATVQLEPEQQTVPGYRLPSVELLEINRQSSQKHGGSELEERIQRLEKTLNDFGVRGKISDVSYGPAITRYEFQPAAGIKVSKIVNLSDDIALSMAVAGVRIEAPIPGKAAVGIEIPNRSTTMVGLRELIESEAFQNSSSKLTVALGKDISGQAVVADLAKMPHLLIAGSTGSGKSVCINTLINSVLYKATPDEVKFVMVDPKKVELGNYNGIPHLISPVVTDAKKAASALRWAVSEMDRRYDLFASHGVKDMVRFNRQSQERLEAAQTEEEKAAIEIMPYIVVLIDELADLMMVAPADVEDAICRLAQLARAAGIHLVVATQRPSVDVITGIIKANMPSRIAFAVSSQTDSRTILDMGGAEKLLGRGDMLFYPTGMAKPQRVQGVYVSDKEIDRIVEAVKEQAQPVYNEEIGTAVVNTENPAEEAEEWDELIGEATRLFIENGQASISLLQRRFRVGYTRAARIIDQMEQRGLVGPYEGSKPRQVRITMMQYEDMLESGEL